MRFFLKSYCGGLLFLLVLVTAPAVMARDITIAFTGDLSGEVFPCGWDIKKGGLARRAGMIQDLRSVYERFILVDCGDMYFNTRTLPEKRAGLMFESMAYMGYDAVNVAEGELAFGTGFLVDRYESSPLPLVSATLEIPDHKDVIKPYIIKSVGGITVGITGMTPKVMFSEDIYRTVVRSADDPIVMLRQTLDELSRQVDIVVLLMHFGSDGTKNFLRYNQLTDKPTVVVAGHGRFMTDVPVMAGETLIVQNSMGGEYLSILTLQLDEAGRIIGHEQENIALTDDIKEDPHLLSKMDEFKQAEAQDKRQQKQTRKVSDSENKKENMLQFSPEQFIRRMTIEKDPSE